MIFTELRFLGFFLAVFVLHWLITSRSARHVLLLVASYAFYAAWDARFLSLIILSSMADYAAGRLLGTPRPRRQRKAILATTVTLNLGLLGVFKYFNFFAASLADLAARFDLTLSQPTLHLVLPVGISFYTFQSLSYTVDVYRGQLKPERNPLTYALYIAFFPQLVAGPIMRARDFLPQFRRTAAFSDIAWRPLLLLFLWGYAKKAVFSDNVAPYVDALFATPQGFNTTSHWLGVILYAGQIYCDFSGYSDMAIATAGLLGYKLCLNFDHPYVSTSPRKFWHRWHISLSTWLRDYVYVPLGGSRVAPTRLTINLMLTMLLGGLWHGAAWTFVAWGGLHGLALVIDRQIPRPPTVGVGARAAGWIITMLVVLLGWVLFRATDFTNAMMVFKGLAGRADDVHSLPGILWAYAAGAVAIQWVAARGLRFGSLLEHLHWPAFAFTYGVLAGIVLLFVNTAYRAFIYFQF